MSAAGPAGHQSQCGRVSTVLTLEPASHPALCAHTLHRAHTLHPAPCSLSYYRHRQPAGNVPSHISLLEEPVNDDTFLEPFPSSKRRLHTEDEPIVASPHAASMSPVIMNSSSSMSPNKSLLREATGNVLCFISCAVPHSHISC